MINFAAPCMIDPTSRILDKNTEHATPSLPEPVNAGFWRRMMALLYDSLLVLGIVFFTSLMLFMISGHAYQGPLYQTFIYLLIGAFYSYFWHVRGQTLGMQAWKIKTVNDRGEILTLGECAVRYFFATFSLAFMGLGFVWILFDPEKLAWHDRASGTRVLFLGKDAYNRD